MIHRKKKGFSLIEMLVVIAIIAVLVAIVVPVIGKSTLKAAAATNAANLRAAKGAFTTLKLMNPEDYTAWTGGTVALTGVRAEDEKFVVSGNTKSTTAPVVAAPNAVEQKTEDTTILEGTRMTAQIIKNEDGLEEVYVTYNDLPISYFAEVAENGTANPDEHRKTNTLGMQSYYDKYTDRANTAFGAFGASALSSTLSKEFKDELSSILQDPGAQGDCLKCAMNNVDFMGETTIWLADKVADGKISNKLTSAGYQYVGDNNTKTCIVYDGDGTTGESGKCSCGHGPDSHITTTTKISIGAGFDACEKGGVHEYYSGHGTASSHECKKCGYILNQKCKTVESLPVIGSLMEDECMYCGYCGCCEAGTFHMAAGIANANICISIDSGDKGCGHTIEQHGIAHECNDTTSDCKCDYPGCTVEFPHEDKRGSGFLGLSKDGKCDNCGIAMS